MALFPVIEWVIHVGILHWRPAHASAGVPRRLAARAQAPRAPRRPAALPLVFIPWQVELWLLPSYVVLALLRSRAQALGATFLVAVDALMFNYEWVHYLVHSDYRPRSRAFRSVWRNHRLHHYKNEHYWFTVTTRGHRRPALRHLPGRREVPTSKTVRQLHALEEGR